MSRRDACRGGPRVLWLGQSIALAVAAWARREGRKAVGDRPTEVLIENYRAE